MKLMVDNNTCKLTLLQERMGASVWPAVRQSKFGARTQIGGVKGRSPTMCDAAILLGDSQKKIWLHDVNGVTALQVIVEDADEIVTRVKDQYTRDLLMRGRMVHYNGYIDVDPAPASIAVTDAQSDEVEAVTTRVSKRTAASLDKLLREADEFKKPPKHSKVTFCAPSKDFMKAGAQ